MTEEKDVSLLSLEQQYHGQVRGYPFYSLLFLYFFLIVCSHCLFVDSLDVENVLKLIFRKEEFYALIVVFVLFGVPIIGIVSILFPGE